MNLCLPLSLKNGNLGDSNKLNMFPKFLWPTVPSDSGILMKEAGCGLPGVTFLKYSREKAAEWKWQGRSCWNYSCQQLVALWLKRNVRLNRFINFSSLQVCRWNEQKGLIESCTKNRRGELVGEVSMPQRMRATCLKWKDLETTSEL